MDRIDEFMGQVFTNMRREKINLDKSTTISLTKLQGGIMRYFGLLHEKSARPYLIRLVELGYFKSTLGGFELTGLAIKKFGGKTGAKANTKAQGKAIG